MTKITTISYDAKDPLQKISTSDGDATILTMSSIGYFMEQETTERQGIEAKKMCLDLRSPGPYLSLESMLGHWCGPCMGRASPLTS